MRRRQGRAPYHLFALVVPEPILTRLEAGSDWVSGRLGMLRGMLIGGTITTTNVPAFRATAQVKPPRMGFRTFHTARATGLRRRIDASMKRFHIFSPPVESHRAGTPFFAKIAIFFKLQGVNGRR
jgi:hypothetical protein